MYCEARGEGNRGNDMMGRGGIGRERDGRLVLSIGVNIDTRKGLKTR